LAVPGRNAQRSCLGCRRVMDRDQLVRYALSPEGEILVDYRKKLPGRGAYTCPDSRCLLAAVKGRQFDRAFKGGNKKPSPEALLEELTAQVRERILNLIGMARKSGNAIFGSSMVLEALREPGRLAVILLAEDISAGIGEKVRAKATLKGLPCFCLSDKATLGRLSGKAERSVAGLKTGPLADTVKGEILRYEKIVGEI
jgi:predicted RNA-binding protein YlxR (DUF448 family)/ribosomal protein L30E